MHTPSPRCLPGSTPTESRSWPKTEISRCALRATRSRTGFASNFFRRSPGSTRSSTATSRRVARPIGSTRTSERASRVRRQRHTLTGRGRGSRISSIDGRRYRPSTPLFPCTELGDLRTSFFSTAGLDRSTTLGAAGWPQILARRHSRPPTPLFLCTELGDLRTSFFSRRLASIDQPPWVPRGGPKFWRSAAGDRRLSRSRAVAVFRSFLPVFFRR
jgi:hypothetical protein